METNTGTPRKRHVLIVDDEVALAWSLKQILEARGYLGTIVPDGGLALKFVMDHPLDAVVCDLESAQLEGDLLFATVERMNPSLARRFLFITGEKDPAPFKRFLDASGLHKLQKPVGVEQIFGEVQRLVESL